MKVPQISDREQLRVELLAHINRLADLLGEPKFPYLNQLAIVLALQEQLSALLSSPATETIQQTPLALAPPFSYI